MTNTLPTEKWGLTESADWWSAGQARRQQIYGPATEMMLEVASVQPGSRVLDVAAGTGDQTLMAARRVGPTGNVLATDDSASMLKVAAEAARNEGLTNVETRIMNAENLALDADSFDAVICRNALMLFPNPAKALAEMRRVERDAVGELVRHHVAGAGERGEVGAVAVAEHELFAVEEGVVVVAPEVHGGVHALALAVPAAALVHLGEIVPGGRDVGVGIDGRAMRRAVLVPVRRVLAAHGGAG